MPPKRIESNSTVSKTARSEAGGWRDKLPPEDLDELKGAFDLFDANSTGIIDPVEVEKQLAELGLKSRNAVVASMLDQLKLVNKPVNFDEFLQIICGRLGDAQSREGLRKLFALYDPDDEGLIGFDQFKMMARQLGETMHEEDIIEMMQNVNVINNTESNEVFDFEEFYQIVTRKRTQ